MLANVQWFNLHCVNLRIYSSFIPDPTTGNTEEVSEVKEEDNTLFDQEVWGRRVKKEGLGTKGYRDD